MYISWNDQLIIKFEFGAYVAAYCTFWPLDKATVVSIAKWLQRRRSRRVLTFRDTNSVVTMQLQFRRKNGTSVYVPVLPTIV
jgi:hypothetical protein